MHIGVVKGDEAAIKSLVYGNQSSSVIDYFKTNLHNVASTVKNVSSDFFNTASNLWEKYNSNKVLDAAKSLLYSMGGHFNQDIIHTVRYENIPNANLIMQKYIMCHPEVNSLYRKNSCNGFEGTYYNEEPNVWGKDRLDYQRVMDGVFQFESNGDGYVEFYSNEDTQDELNIYDKLSILETWDSVSNMLANKMDPTDPDEGEL